MNSIVKMKNNLSEEKIMHKLNVISVIWFLTLTDHLYTNALPQISNSGQVILCTDGSWKVYKINFFRKVGSISILH